MAIPRSYFGETIMDSTVKDNGQPETTSWQVPVTTLTAANYVAKKTLIDALKSAVDGVIIGVVHQTAVTIDRDLISDTPASSNLAQRENKLLIRYHDNVSLNKFRVTIGTFDLTTLPAHKEFLDLTAGVGVALKDAFEAIVVSPDDDSHSVTMDSAQFVGRTS